jgi:hypothetical protein
MIDKRMYSKEKYSIMESVNKEFLGGLRYE